VTDVLTGLPAASWYPDPDPAHPHLLRWWDGSAWSVYTMDATDDAETPEVVETPAPAPQVTEPVTSAPDLPPVLHTVPQPIPEPMPFATGVSLGADGLRSGEPAMLTPIERAARAEIYANLARSHASEDAAPTRSRLDPFGDFSNSPRMNGNSPGTLTSQQPMYPDVPLSSSTLGVWLLVLWPTAGSLLGKFLVAMVLSMPTPNSRLIALIAIAAGFLLLPFVFAAMDRRALGQIGHDRRPSGWWLLTTWLGYLIARTVIISRRSARAFAPLVVFVLIGVGNGAYSVLTSPEFGTLISR
jgi:hypothetical protein